MKKVNVLSKAQMKNVLGGKAQSICDTGDYNDYSICFNCCLADVEEAFDPTENGLDSCDILCGG